MKLLKKFLYFIITMMLLSIITAGGLLLFSGYKEYKIAVSGIPIEDKIQDIRQTDGYVELNEVSKNFTNGIIAIEDHRFYSHSGLDIIGIGRAMAVNLKEKEIVQGGSTITQQLAKNLYFDTEQVFTRKIAEAIMAKKLEKIYTKDEILELYINIIYYGENYYGIGQATQGYFQKSPKEITLEEGSILAGLPQAPNAYSLDQHINIARERQKMVLNAMIKYGYISKEEAEEAIIE